MRTVLHGESLAALQIEPAAALSPSAEPAPCVDGAGIVLGLLLGAAIWLIVFAVAFLLIW